jgi:hypothetical protein
LLAVSILVDSVLWTSEGGRGTDADLTCAEPKPVDRIELAATLGSAVNTGRRMAANKRTVAGRAFLFFIVAGHLYKN